MSQIAEDIQKQLQHGLDELRTLRDDIRVRLHLAGMEAKTRWNEELEPRLVDFERNVKETAIETGEKAAEATRKALSEIAEAYHSFRDSLSGADSKDQSKPDQGQDAGQAPGAGQTKSSTPQSN